MKQDQRKVKVLFILVDGLGELGLKAKEYQTIGQIENFPHINALAETGVCGVMDPVEPGLACGSDTAHMSIFGYDPFTLYRGRGAFETIGSGIPMDFNEIAFKCNFAHMDPQTGKVLKRRVDRDFEKWGLPLIDEINGMKLSIYSENDTIVTARHATEHRIGLKITNNFVSDKITGTDPLKDNLPLQKVRAVDINDEFAKKSAIIVNTLSQKMFEVLSKHPINLEREKLGLPTANIVLMRGCGQKLKVDTFEKLHNLKGFMIAPTAIINGLGQTIGLEILKVAGTTGDYHTNLNNKGFAALKHLRESDKNFGFLHIKAVDDAGHDKSLELKIKFLQKTDEMIANIIKDHYEKKDDFELIIVFTGDHTTPLQIGDHSYEPVPFAITTISALQHKLFNSIVNQKILNIRDNVSEFNDISCSFGLLGRFCGGQLFSIIQNFIQIIQRI